MGTQYPGADAFPSSYTIPDDGDDVDAADVNVAFEALGDRTIYLSNRQGAYQLLGVVADFSSATYNLTIGATVELDYTGIEHGGSGFGMPLVGDVYEYSATINCQFIATLSVSNPILTAVLEDEQNGAGSYTQWGGTVPAKAGVQGVVGSALQSFSIPLSVVGVQTISAAGPYNARLRLNLTGGGAGDSVEITGYSGCLKVWRPN